MCELCKVHFLGQRRLVSRHAALRAELDRSYRRLGHILYEREFGAPREDDDPLVPPSVAPIALLLAAKIRDLNVDMQAARPG